MRFASSQTGGWLEAQKARPCCLSSHVATWVTGALQCLALEEPRRKLIHSGCTTGLQCTHALERQSKGVTEACNAAHWRQATKRVQSQRQAQQDSAKSLHSFHCLPPSVPASRRAECSCDPWNKVRGMQTTRLGSILYTSESEPWEGSRTLGKLQ